jgi:hypothetical protein
MGLFGSARLRDKSLANPEQYVPGFRPDIPEPQPMDEMTRGMPQGLGSVMQTPQIKPHVGAFDRGGLGWTIIGSIGDGLSQMGGYGAPFAKAREHRQDRELEEAQWTRRQDSELASKRAMYDYELQHPKPTNNDTVADYDFWRGKLTPEQFQQYVANKINPPHFATLPNGQMGMVGGYTPPVAAPAPGTVEDGHVFMGGNPGDPNSWKPVGGAGQSGPRTFR